MLYIFVSTLALMVDSLECSSHSARGPDSEHNSIRASSSSPSITNDSLTVLGHSKEELGYIRLIPRTNDSLQFEFRRYCFPVGKPIRLRADQNRRVPVPTQEQIVLSLSNGDVFAIFDYSGILTAIYSATGNHKRVKLNMISSKVEDMTPDEITICPVGKYNPITPQSFNKIFTDDDSLQSVWNHHTEPHEAALHHSRNRYFASRPLSDRILGCSIERLGYFRLISCANPHQRFEFRRYNFPTDMKIRIKIERWRYEIMPNQEYLVLSTYDGDVFAIMDYCDVLRGIYRIEKPYSRIKMNMISGELNNLTPDEMSECPVGKNHNIFPKSFMKAFENYDSLQNIWNFNSRSDPGSSYSARQHSPDLTPHQEPTLRARSRSPPGKPPSDRVLGYSLAELGYIRLIPKANRNQRFEFRRYVISADRPIRLMLSKATFVPVPAREHIVLSTSNDEVFAILEYTGILRGIYATNAAHSRVKISMMSGTVKYMTDIEKEECHVGKYYPVSSRWFHEYVSSEDSLQHVYQ